MNVASRCEERGRGGGIWEWVRHMRTKMWALHEGGLTRAHCCSGGGVSRARPAPAQLPLLSHSSALCTQPQIPAPARLTAPKPPRRPPKPPPPRAASRLHIVQAHSQAHSRNDTVQVSPLQRIRHSRQRCLGQVLGLHADVILQGGEHKHWTAQRRRQRRLHGWRAGRAAVWGKRPRGVRRCGILWR